MYICYYCFHIIQAPNAKSDPQQKIHRITNRVPDDSRSPFYGSEPIRPLAVLRIERISQPEGGDQPRQCTDTDTDDSDTDFIGTGGGADGGAGLSDAEKQKQMMMSQDGLNRLSILVIYNYSSNFMSSWFVS